MKLDDVRLLLGLIIGPVCTGIKLRLFLRTVKNICSGTPYWQSVHLSVNHISTFKSLKYARRTGSDGSMCASGSVGPGFDPRRGSKFSLENFQPRG